MNTKTIEIILKGLLAQDPDLLLKRLSHILSKTTTEDTVDALVNGVIVDVKLNDEDEIAVEKMRKYFSDHNNSSTTWKHFQVFVESPSSVQVTGYYDKTVYCKTQEDADRRAKGGSTREGSYDYPRDDYQIPVVVEDCSIRVLTGDEAIKNGLILSLL